jgi:alkanesulfonate monooxygenase SsuD/methylene tetrahydromethanopterin reductase-like flavin-dependent oxidoreductase (luciferase family)
LTRFGCSFLQERPWHEFAPLCREIEEAGFDSLWVADHLMSYPRVGPMLEAWTMLGAIAASTTRIRIGTLVTNITYRNPALLAKEAITVDHISNGRVIVGVGAAGTREADPEVAGIEPWTKTERVERFAEFVEMLEGLLAGRFDAYDGRFYRTKGFDRGPWPVQHPRPPLMIAAHGERTLRVTAKYADQWNGLAGFGRTGAELFAFLKSTNATLDDLAVAAGRDPGAIRRSVLVGQVGEQWWSSGNALRDLIGRFGEAGIQDMIFNYPSSRAAPEYVTPERFMDVVAPAVAELSS